MRRRTRHATVMSCCKLLNASYRADYAQPLATLRSAGNHGQIADSVASGNSKKHKCHDRSVPTY